MHAVTIADGELVWAERPDPVAGPGQVVVDVSAAGLNGADMMQRRGFYPAPSGAPADIPGLELAGTISSLGAGVTDWAVGDRVMAIVAGGGQAEQALVRADHLLRVPSSIDWSAAGGFAETFTTAYDALVTQCEMAAGDRVLVQGAAGGVGTAGVQLAAAWGCTVVASVRNADHRAAVEALGATLATAPEDAFAAGPFDVVLELVGAPNLPGDLDALNLGGRIAVIGVGAGARTEVNLLTLMGKRARIHGSTLRARPDDEKADVADAMSADVLPLLRKGALSVPVAATFPMSEASAAYDAFAAGGKLGKIVLVR